MPSPSTDAESPQNPVLPAVYQLPLQDDTSAPADDGRIACWARVDHSLLQQNAAWFCRLRWVLVGLFAVAGAAAFLGIPVEALGLQAASVWPTVIALVLAGLNLGDVVLLRRVSDTVIPPHIQLWLQIIVDLVILTVVIHFLGSVGTHAPFLYLFHIVLACIFFSPAESLAVVLISVLLYAVCLTVEASRFVEPTSVLLNSGIVNRSLLTGTFWLWHVASMLLIWLVIWYLVSRLACALREREYGLATANAQLEASSEERSLHMLQTTHQLKAPFAAVHANVQVLLEGACGTLPDSARQVVERIADRCEALSHQILKMLQLANLRSEGQSAAPRTEIDLGQLIRTTIERIGPAAVRRGITIQSDLQSLYLGGVEDHLQMLIDNLLSNAVNYSLDDGEVTVQCSTQPDGAAQVVIRDHGIGIPADKLPKVFDDYFRTREAVRHNKASTGLGLSIVSQVARAAGIQVQVESAPQWGTRFQLTIPHAQTDSPPPDQTG